MAIDWTEIPPNDSDRFEQFAAAVMTGLGLSIEDGPDRGPDGGRDLIALEPRSGPLGTTCVRWLVSCKHFAGSGTAVGPARESNIQDRVREHSADGFLGFYSTLPTSGLTTRLKSMPFETKVVADKQVEALLLRLDGGSEIVARFFPLSSERFRAIRTNVADERLRSRHAAHREAVEWTFGDDDALP